MKLIKTLLLAIALGAASSASAIPLHFNFVGTVTDSNAVPNGTMFGGSASVTGTGSGFELFTPDNSNLQISFSLGDFVFWNELDDIDFPFFPELTTVDGAFDSIDFIGINDDGIELGVFGDASGLDFFITAGGAFADGSAVVPEPGTLGLIGLGLLGLAITRRRRSA